MALFGQQVEQTFMKLHQARRYIEVAVQMLADKANDEHNQHSEDTRQLYKQLRRDVSDHGTFEPEKDRVGHLLRDFVAEIIALADPVIARQYRPSHSRLWHLRSSERHSCR
jgi:hypothetical protein